MHDAYSFVQYAHILETPLKELTKPTGIEFYHLSV